ncbi:MAG TPA: alpha/beta hydrolase [Aestuariivirgaceae bacterium]|jgi:lysophospholipase
MNTSNRISDGARLIGYPGNSVPDGTECGFFTASDGRRLRYALLREGQGFKGTVCLLHGRGDFIERYFETMDDLRQRGFAVATFDWRGQGGSQRGSRNPWKNHVRRFSDYEDDLQSFIAKILMPDCPPPYYALAHSMGGCILVLALRRHAWFNKAVLTAPMFDIRTAPWPRWLARILIPLFCMTGLGRLFVPGERRRPMGLKDFPANNLTSDLGRYTRDVHTVEIAPELGVGAPTLRWVKAAFKAMEEIMSPPRNSFVRVPVLIVAADKELVTSNEACHALAAREPSVVTVVVDYSRHEILMERDEVREQFWAAFEAFIEGKDPTREPSR